MHVNRLIASVPGEETRRGGFLVASFKSMSIDRRRWERYLSAITNRNRDRFEPSGRSLTPTWPIEDRMLASVDSSVSASAYAKRVARIEALLGERGGPE